MPLAPQPGFQIIIRNYRHNYKKNQQLSVQLLTARLHQTRGMGTTAIRLIRWNSGWAAPSQSIKLVNFAPFRVFFFFNIGVYKTSGPAGIYCHQKWQNQRSQRAENDQEYRALQSAEVQPERPLYALRGLVAGISADYQLMQTLLGNLVPQSGVTRNRPRCQIKGLAFFLFFF